MIADASVLLNAGNFGATRTTTGLLQYVPKARPDYCTACITGFRVTTVQIHFSYVLWSTNVLFSHPSRAQVMSARSTLM
jgi:hypothetical protein